MISIRRLEKLLAPYKTSNWGASDGFGNTYQGYKKGKITSRLDTAAWFLVKKPREVYKNELVRIATELGIL